MSPSRQQTIIHEGKAGLGASTNALIRRLQPSIETEQFLAKFYAPTARNPVAGQNAPVELLGSI